MNHPTEITATITLYRPGICPRFGVWDPEAAQTHELRAEVLQDDGIGFESDLLIVWLDAAHVADLGMDEEEYMGAIEAVEDAWAAAQRRATVAKAGRERTGQLTKVAV
jgi:hypothetical protein